MILYNVSINRAGLMYLMELRVCRVLDRYMNESASTDLKQLCLRLLQSVTYKLEDESTIADILAIVTIKRIEELSRTEPENLAAIAKKVSSNLQKSQLTLERKGLSVRGDQLGENFPYSFTQLFESSILCWTYIAEVVILYRHLNEYHFLDFRFEWDEMCEAEIHKMRSLSVQENSGTQNVNLNDNW